MSFSCLDSNSFTQFSVCKIYCIEWLRMVPVITCWILLDPCCNHWEVPQDLRDHGCDAFGPSAG